MKSSRFRKSAKAFQDFTGHRAARVSRARLESADVAGWKMGPVVGIAYEATRDGKRRQYFHEFAKPARPDLVAREDGRQLFITGGKYAVTERGIEDMPELFIVNPSSRRSAAKGGKAMAATKRNSKGRFTRARAAPKRKSRPRQVAVFNANPIKRRRRAVAKAAPRRRRFRRNPSGRGLMPLKGLGQMIIPAAGVGGGAVVAEIVMGYLPIPADWKQGVMRHVTKGAVGIGAGWAISHLFKQKRLGFYVMAGAVVIATHDAIKEFIASKAPNIHMGQYVEPLASQFGGMGYVNSAQITRLGQYVRPLASQFDGVSQAYDPPGGETDFRA